MRKLHHEFTEVYIDCDAYHGLDCGGCPGDMMNYTKDKKCNACVFASDYGTGLTTQEAVLAYMAGCAATFYQAFIGGISGDLMDPLNPKKSQFIECPNYRNKCVNLANNPNCTNSTCIDN